MNPTLYKLANIELDETIRCRVHLADATLDTCAARMRSGELPPPVQLFGNRPKAWIGDGWYRVVAAHRAGLTELPAQLHNGGRLEALRYALGQPDRTLADRHWGVCIALREFSTLSCRALSKLCLVNKNWISRQRRKCGSSSTPLTASTEAPETVPAPDTPATLPSAEETQRVKELWRAQYLPEPEIMAADQAARRLVQIKGKQARLRAFDYLICWMLEHET